MEFLKQPKPMTMDGDVGTNWKRFKQNFSTYFVATGAKEKSVDVQNAVLLHCMGEEARETYETFETKGQKVDEIIQLMDDYYIPKINTSIERNKFNNRVQANGESFDTFLTDLRKIATNCNYGAMKESLIVDRIICGIKNKTVKDRLLREQNINLKRAIDICKAAEQTEQHIKDIVLLPEKVSVEEIETMRHRQYKGKRTQHDARGHKGAASSRNVKEKQETDKDRYVRACERCGMQHKRNVQCPARGQRCNYCKMFNHFAKVCRKNKYVNSVNAFDDIENKGTINYVIDTLQISLLNSNEAINWFQNIKIVNSKVVKFKLDTGAQINVIPKYIFDKLKLNIKLKKTYIKVTNYGGNELSVIGSCTLVVNVNGQECKLDFIVIKTDNSAAPILGVKACAELKLIKRDVVINEIENNGISRILIDNEDLFKGLGKIKSKPVDFSLKKDYIPKVVPCRKVPFPLIGKLDQTLKQMVSDKVIVPIKESTEFVNPIVIVNKSNGDIRICLDPQNLNRAILREYYKLPTFEEITHDIKDSQFFSILDANKGFWQIELSEAASKLTTFATPCGRFRFLRLPFGLCNAPEMFHRTFTEIFGVIKGVKIYIDDLIIYAKTEKEHDLILKQVLDRARELGVKFNKEKCQFKVSKVKYVGHILTSKGIMVDEEKIEAITKIPTPTNAKELTRFLGMITYVSKFIPNLAKLTSNLRQLTKKEIVWLWTKTHDNEFNYLKKLLTESPVLQYYDEKEDIVLSVDSSKDGLGAVILQEGKPVAYASKTLTETQKNYAQIEKETLAILFGCQRFHQFLFGKSFIVESDHKPLEIIFKKPINECPLRLQRFRISLQTYDFEIKYKPGSQLFVADTLSRACNKDEKFEINESEVEAQVNIINYASISPQKFNLLQKETQRDFELITLKKVIREGWPENKKHLDVSVRPYWKFRDNLTIMREVIYRGNQMVIPKSMRKEILERLHYNHMGIQKTLLRANELVYWPYISKEIRDVVSNCTACLTYQKSNQKQEMIKKEVPNRPWQIVAADLFHFKESEYLLLVDVYSKFPEVVDLKTNTTNQNVIKSFKEIFARQGKPDILYTDNGPQFANQNFQNFVTDWEICHKTSSPRYPQSNGFIERHVQIIKKLLKKAHYDKKDVFLTLLEYRNTPISKQLQSPAQLLYNRRLKGHMIINEKLLEPSDDKNYKQLKKLQDQQKVNYDAKAKNLPNLSQGDKVMVLNDNKIWEPGVIVKIDKNRPRAYLVKLNKNDRTVVRNRLFLRKYDKDNFKKELFDKLSKDFVDVGDGVGKYSETCNSDRLTNSDNTVPECDKTIPNNEQLSQSKEENPVKVKEKEEVKCKKSRVGREIRKPMYLEDYV